MLALCLSFLISVLDQAAKYAVTRQFRPGESVPLLPGFFNLTYVRNTGAAWGMLGGLNSLLTAFSVAMLILIVLFRRRIISDVLSHRVALGLMMGGIVGNLMDRVRLHHVVDFLDFYRGPHHFPSFNVADSAICVGVGLYVVSSFWLAMRPLSSGQTDEQTLREAAPENPSSKA